MILPQEPDLLIEKDIYDVVRELRHLQTPAEGDPGQPAKRAALEYLTQASSPERHHLLPLSYDDLSYLENTIESDERKRSSKVRFAWAESRELKRNDRIETTIVWVQQTAPIGDFAVDLEGNSLRLVVHWAQESNRPQITSVRSTTVENAELPLDLAKLKDVLRGRLDAGWADQLDPELAQELLESALGLGESIGIANARLVAYEREGATVDGSGRLGVAVSATVFIPVASGDSIAHRLLIDLLPAVALARKTPIVSACAGYAFLSDPVTKTGSFRLRPDSGADLLNPERDPVALLDLKHVGGGRRELSGPRVRVLSPAALGHDYDPPVRTPPFAFSSRTNEFAAVSAYCHCDSMMQLVEQFGFVLSDYFKKVALPLTVEHRAKMLTGPGARDGRGINAYVTPFRTDNLAPPWDVRMLFGLADFADSWNHPLGLAADIRFVWHEFCHVLILAATGSTEFDFAHSAGDALGAIMSDPTSKLSTPWRGVTFPFIQLPLRRHDRKVDDGWGWNGTLYEKPHPTYGLRDPAGYNSEQILSSTVFQLYLAAGGDAVRPNADGGLEADVDVRRATAYYIAYLIVSAIASLAHVAIQSTGEVNHLATALMDADVGTPYLDYDGARRLGGMLHKVIRWAFEKQGLYQTAPNGRKDEPGSPPSIDIYVDDRRKGNYEYCNDWQALPAVLWVRHAADGQPGDQAPRPGYVNYVYVYLGNRGDQPAIASSVDVLAAVGDATDTWDGHSGYWQELQGSNATMDVPPGERSAMFGPFEWTPKAGVNNGLLARATAAGDRSNIDAGSNLPCAAGPVPLTLLVRADNNLGFRKWTDL
jgi:hypothetical protein